MAGKSRADTIVECYRRATEARRTADATTDPMAKADFHEIEQRWLLLARSYGSKSNADF
jgi:hypothetical protein